MSFPVQHPGKVPRRCKNYHFEPVVCEPAGRALNEQGCVLLLRAASAAFPSSLKEPYYKLETIFPDGNIEAKTLYSAGYNKKKKENLHGGEYFCIIPV